MSGHGMDKSRFTDPSYTGAWRDEAVPKENDVPVDDRFAVVGDEPQIVLRHAHGGASSLRVMCPDGDIYNLKRLSLFAKQYPLADELYQWLFDTMQDVGQGKLSIDDFPIAPDDDTRYSRGDSVPTYDPTVY